MQILNPRIMILRLVVFAILLAMTYPFLPAKQQWQVESAFGSSEADSLLNEYYEEPTEGALQFSLEFSLEIRTVSRTLAYANDIRYVTVADKVWGEGKLWSIHLRRHIVEKIEEHMSEHPDESIYVVLDNDWEWRVELDLPEARSPIYVDPAGFSTDPYFVTSVLESWYHRPYLPGSAMIMPEIPDGY